MRIVIINGPNLNLLGKREPEVYGDRTFDTYFDELKRKYPEVELEYLQSNVEGELISMIQEAGFYADGIILNAAAYTHTSVGIGDAVKAVPSPVAEVHISNVYQRESYRHESFVSPGACGVIAGFGLLGYELALLSFIKGLTRG